MKVTLLILTLTILTFIKNSNAAGSCNCWQAKDSTWQVAAFNGTGASGGPGLPPYYRNDDWSTIPISLPFNFCFYGDTIHDFIINNNGNISFGTAYSTFTANSFPDTTFRMIAPIWCDVDTQDSLLSGIVHYKVFPHYVVIQWDSVGYYAYHGDKRNTFQLIISDGGSSPLPEDKNVGFCYKTLEWTTGDASGGVNGFGGFPATVGVNYGDGINYLQIGLYNDSTMAYDGPYGNNDGIKSLENQSFAFNVCVNNFNVPPILNGEYICDTIQLCIGDTFVYNASFLAPEIGQITTVTIDAHGQSGVNLVTNPGNQASLNVTMVAANAGIYIVDVIGTDDGTPAAFTRYPLIFNIQNCTTGLISLDEKNNFISPNPFNEVLNYSFEKPFNIIVVDPLGKKIHESKNIRNGNINTSGWKNGIYYIVISNEENYLVKKMIKN